VAFVDAAGEGEEDSASNDADATPPPHGRRHGAADAPPASSDLPPALSVVPPAASHFEPPALPSAMPPQGMPAASLPPSSSSFMPAGSTPSIPESVYQAPTQLYEVPADLLASNGRVGAEPPSSPAPSGDTDAEADATFIIPDAMLVESHGALEFRLGAMNYIGRADDNQIRLKSGDISRRHAMISVAQGGYLLRDLQSQNGTYVNGQRIGEHLLAEGDHIRVGNFELTFHYAAPDRQAQGGADAWAIAEPRS
jgi:hypothetical protein